jgi:hypothetical protein
LNEQIDQIVQYIRQYRDTYSREAINTQLLGAGYSRQEIDAAWAQVSVGTPYMPSEGQIPMPPSEQVRAGWGDTNYQPPRRQRVANRPLFWEILVGFTLLSYGLPVLFLLIAGTVNDSAISSLLGWLALGTFGVLQLAAIIWGALSSSRNPPLGMGLLFGVLMTVVVLPFVAFFIVLGICLTSFATI